MASRRHQVSCEPSGLSIKNQRALAAWKDPRDYSIERLVLLHSGFLFAEPNFIQGMSRILDFGVTINQYNASLTPEEADTTAIYSDWLAVGDDLRLAIKITISP